MKLDIENFYPCDDGLDWYNQQKSSIEAWNSCHRGDWMLWIAMKLGVDKNKLTLATAKCANTVRHLMDDERSRNAVDTFIAYVEGRATKDELEEARDEAYDASMAADEAARAAYASASAADVARAAYARAAYARAAYASATAAFYAAGESQEAREANQLQTANICREILTEDIIEILKT